MSAWQVLGTIAALALAIAGWARAANDKKAKDKADEDAKIDAAANADDLLHEFDRLRNK